MFDNIFRPIAFILGKFMNVLFMGMDGIGIGNIGIAIILFTIIIKVAMLPLTFSQQKTVKVTQLMQPEMKAIRAKYKNRRDSESMEAQNAEIKELYAKYGASQTGGCIQMVIQLPILFSLYQVFRNIPIHITKINTLLSDILNGNSSNAGIMSDARYGDIMTNNFPGINWTDTDSALSALNSFKPTMWEQLKEFFPGSADLITSNSQKVLDMNNFLGVNITDVPGQVWGLAILIPILSGVSQFISAKLSQNTSTLDSQSKLQSTLMLFMMPILSVIIAFRMPAGLGIYWIATAVIQTILQLIINQHYKKISPEQIVEQNLEKQKKRLEKKRENPESIIRGATIKTKKIGSGGSMQQSDDSIKARANFAQAQGKAKAKNVKNSSSFNSSPPSSASKTASSQTSNENQKAKGFFGRKSKDSEQSISQKARMVSQYKDIKKTNTKSSKKEGSVKETASSKGDKKTDSKENNKKKK